MKNNIILNICGSNFSITTDEPEEYIRLLEAQVDSLVAEAMRSGASSHKAALFVCMELCDMLEKAKKQNAEAKLQKPKKTYDEVLFPDKDQTSLF